MSPKTHPPSKVQHWALAVLCLLRERDMHPYEMRLIIRERHKEERLLLKPGSLYHGIRWLHEQHLIEAINVSRQGKRPERTTYRITSTGEEHLQIWLGELLANPVREASSFAVALDHMVHLSPSNAAAELEKRFKSLEPQAKAMEDALQALRPTIGRINVLELEYECALCRAELAWIQKLSQELRSGSLNWDIGLILSYLRTQAKSRQRTPR